MRWAAAGCGLAALVLASAALRADSLRYVPGDEQLAPPLAAFEVVGTCGTATMADVVVVEVTSPDCWMRAIWALPPTVPVDVQVSARAPAVGELTAVEWLVTDADGPMERMGGDIVAFPGPDATFRTYERAITADLRGGRGLALSADVAGPGRIEVQRVSVTASRERPLWRIARMAVQTGWLGAFVAAIAIAADRLPRRIESLMLLAVVALVAIGVILPAVTNTSVVAQTWHAVDAATRATPAPAADLRFWLMRNLISVKTAHFALFGAIGFLATRLLGRPALVTGAIAALAALSEALELIRLDRTPSFTDVGIDLAGALVGVAIAWGTATLRIRRSRSG